MYPVSGQSVCRSIFSDIDEKIDQATYKANRCDSISIKVKMFLCPQCNNGFEITRGPGKLPKPLSRSSVKDDDDDDDEVEEETDLRSDDNDDDDNNQEGGKSTSSKDVASLIQDIMNSKIVDPDRANQIGIDRITKDTAFKELTVANRDTVVNTVADMLPDNKKIQQIKKDGVESSKHNLAHFLCTNCGFTKPVAPRTKIFSKVSDKLSQNYTSGNYKDMLHSSIAPRTRKYTCPNERCESHKDPEKREAVFIRKNNSYEVVYICTACETVS